MRSSLPSPLLLAATLLAFLLSSPVSTHARHRQSSFDDDDSTITTITCPPPGFSAVPKLNLTAYTSAPWYAQRQAPISYQGEDPLQFLYCVRAEYVPVNDPRVNGPRRNSDDDDNDNGNDSGDEYYDEQQDKGGAVTGGNLGRYGVPVYSVLNYANR
ncbi:hypothetical protein Agub_g5340, partial [Astrephomene gubernaculifera]